MQPYMRIMVFVLCINIFLYIGGVRVINANDASTSFMSNFVDNNTNTTMSPTITNAIPYGSGTNNSLVQQTGIGGFFTFIDVVKSVLSFIIFMVNITFTPMGLILGAGLPIEAGLIIGLPITLLMIFGVIYLIRSGF